MIAKNYLNEDEITKLNDLTNMFLVFAENEAKDRHVMTMQDWINATDDLLKFRRKSSEERILDFISKTKNPYIFKVNVKLVRIRFSETSNLTAEDCLTNCLKSLYK